jgi:transcriptional regulator with XRE-family HTH domain
MDQNWLIERLEYLGWTKRELSKRMDVKPYTVTRWKNIPVPVVEYLKLVCKAKDDWENLK